MLNRYRPAALIGALLMSVVLYGACSSGTEPAKPTTINTNVASVTLASLTATQQITATVLDQNGSAMTGQKVTWSVSPAGVATVDTTGKVTAVANGSTQVTATAGTATKSVPVTVQQVAAQLLTVSGGGQAGTVGQALAQPLIAVARDALGSVVTGAAVTFAVTIGNGTVPAGAVTTGANGQASTTFTLGTVAGSAHQVTATAAGVATGVTFGATAAAGAASAIQKMAGDGQTTGLNLSVTVSPRVKVTDSFGNAKSGVGVTFAVASGGGGITGATQTTDASGLATIGSWTLGGSAGANTLTATVNSTAITTTFSATAAVAGGPANVAAFVGNNQPGLIGYALNIRPAVLVTDANGVPVGAASVTFAVASGGGSVSGPTVSTNANGIAQVGSWTVGGSAGANTLTATVAGSGITGNPVTFNATGLTGAYAITIQNYGPALSAGVQAAFDAAVAKWQSIVYQDVGPFSTGNQPAGTCGAGTPALNQTVNDLLILVNIDSIDGPNNILGQAYPCLLRPSPSGLTLVGVMKFDSSDVNTLLGAGLLNSVILHEMGHVLGFGSLWSVPQFSPNFACLQAPGTAGQPAASQPDTYFNCAGGRAAFDSIGGTNYTGGNKVPVENCGPSSPGGCGSGTINVHWREPTFGPELMSGYLNGGQPNPLSLLSVASLQDLGYGVNFAAADAFVRTFTVALRARGPLLNLGDDIGRHPMYVVDRAGRLTPVPGR
jgi:hypothetical protein